MGSNLPEFCPAENISDKYAPSCILQLLQTEQPLQPELCGYQLLAVLAIFSDNLEIGKAVSPYISTCYDDVYRFLAIMALLNWSVYGTKIFF